MTNGECNLGEVKFCHWLEKVSLSLHQHEQLPALAIFENEIKFSISLKGIPQLDNVGMSNSF